MKKILVVDGHSILNRAFYGLPDLSNSKGQHTNAVLGFVNILLKVIDEEQPIGLAVAFDVHEKTFRHKMYDAYKGTRKGMPDELRQQVPIIKELLIRMGITVIEMPGFEADDILGTMSRMGENNGYEVILLSGDRDLLQLATKNTMIKIPKTKAGKTTVENYYDEDVIRTYGVTPTEFIDMKGLMGDTSDNIPGVPGIGEKTAGKIIATYHSIEEAYAHLEDITPKKARENFEAFYDQALMSKVLATIKVDVPLDVNLEELLINDLFTTDAYEYMKELELKSLLKNFSKPQENIHVDFHMNLIQDLSEMEQYFAGLTASKVIGVSAVFEKKELIAIGITKDGRQVDCILCSMFITEDLIANRLQEIFEGDNPPLIVTNDGKRLMKVVPLQMDCAIFDSSLAAYLLNPIKESYLYDDIARDYLQLTLPSKKELIDKLELSPFVMDEQKVKDYIAYETCIPFLAMEQLEHQLRDKGMHELYHEIEIPTLFVLDHMEKEGIQVDAGALKEYGIMLGNKITVLEQEIYKEAGCEFNINSPKQLGEILFEKLNLPGAKKTKTGYSTNVDVLNKLKNDYPIVAHVLEYRQVAKLKSTYADGLAAFISSDGRIHGTFNQTITATGRISSTEPNLQNIPMRTELGRSIRKVFVPKEGCVFVDADYSQIELRILAHFSKDEKLIQSFKENDDIHTLTASQVFHVPVSQVDAIMRRNAKAVNFGIVYGISAFGLSEDLNISRKEATEYMEGYFATYPGVKKFQEETVDEAKKTGITKTLFHRIRPIPEISSSNFMQRSFGERIAMNSPIQGTAADIIKIAMIRVYTRMKKEGLKSSLILQIHDELLIEAYKEEVDDVKAILQEEMMQAVQLSVPLLVEACVGNDWYEAK
ncbi:MAG: DNA polymerase I [Lachnospiraceae bacterium]